MKWHEFDDMDHVNIYALSMQEKLIKLMKDF